jgi:hypothetical protein
MHLPDPASVLRHLLSCVHPGGLVAFQEYDLSSHQDAFYPPSSLWEQTYRLCTLAFQQAGLPAPHMRYEASIGADRDWPGFAMRADDVRTFLPRIVKFGLATEEEVDIETLAERLRAETVGQSGAARLPVVVSAWTRIAS